LIRLDGITAIACGLALPCASVGNPSPAVQVRFARFRPHAEGAGMSRIRKFALATVLAFVAPFGHGAEVRAVVYFHETFHHYFMTADAGEIDALDRLIMKGWWRAGQRFRVDDEPGAGLVPVCRFLTVSHGGKASHFFTASAAECELVKGKPDWTYEGIAFHARLPVAGSACAAGTTPIHRLYNGGRGGAPNHAYTPETAQRERLKANGFVEEGVAFCARVEGEPAEKLQPLLGTSWDFDWGNDGTGGLGVMRATFGSTIGTTSKLDSTFFALGLPLTGENATYSTTNSEGMSGAVTWDRVSASYLMFLEHPFGLNSVYAFDAFDPVKLSLCTFDVFWSVPGDLPAFQPMVWSGWSPAPGCNAGTARRR
jgi:serine protease